MVKSTQTQHVLRLCLLIGLISFASCSILERDRAIDQLDLKVKSLFNQKSPMSNYRTANNKDNSKLYHLEYQSGLKTTLNVNNKGVSIVQYQLGSDAKKSRGAKWSQKCYEEKKPKILSQAQVESYLRKNNEFDSSFALVSFSVTNSGYLIEYSNKNTILIFELDWNLRIRRKQSKKIVKTVEQIPESIEVDQKTTKLVVQFLNRIFRFKNYNQASIESIEKNGHRKYKVIFSIRIRERVIRYQIWVSINSAGEVEIEDTKQIDSKTPQYAEESQINSDELIFVKRLLEQNLTQRVPEGFKLVKIERDGIYFRFYYVRGNERYIIEFKFDPINKRVKIGRLHKELINKSQSKTEIISENKKVEVVRDDFDDNKKEELVNFVRSSFNTLPKSARVEKVSRLGQRRFLIVVIVTIRKREIRYQFIVNQNPSGTYAVEDSQFNLDFTPSYQEFPTIDDSAITGLDGLVRDSLQGKIPSTAKLTRVERDEPFFRFYYVFGPSRSQVEFTFDPVSKRINFRNVQTQTIEQKIQIQQPVKVIKETQQTVKIVEQPIIVKKPIQNTEINQVKVVEEKKVINDAQPVVKTPTIKVVSNDFDDAKKDELVNFVRSSFNTLPKSARVQKVTRLGQGRFLIVVIVTIRKREIRYQFIVNQNPSGYAVEDSQFNLDFTPSYQQFPTIDDSAITGLDGLVRQNLKGKIPTNAKLTRVERDEPFFRFYYVFGPSRSQVEFTFDPVAKRINLKNFQTQTIQQKIQIKQPANVIKESQSTVKIAQQPVLIQKPIENTEINQVKIVQEKKVVKETQPVIKTTIIKETSNDFDDNKKQQLVNFVRSSFNTLPKSARVEKVSRLGQRRFLIVIIVTIRKREIRYQFIVNQNPSGTYAVEDSQFNLDFTPSYQEFPTIDDSAITGLDGLVRDSLQGKIPSTAKLTRVERDEPFFRFYYVFGPSRSQVEFTFDPVSKRINFRNVQTQTIEQKIQIQQPTKIKESINVSELPKTQQPSITNSPNKIKQIIKVQEPVEIKEQVKIIEPIRAKEAVQPIKETRVQEPIKVIEPVKIKQTNQVKEEIKIQQPIRKIQQKTFSSTTQEIAKNQANPTIIKTTSTTSTISTSSSTVSNDFDDNKKQQLVNFVRSSFNTLPKSARVEKVSRLGQRRFLIVVIVTIRKREIRYQFIVNQNPSGTYAVEDSQFNLDFTPSYQEFPTIDDSAITGLDGLVRDSLQGKIPSTAKLTRVERDEPFFRFYYVFGPSRSQVEFTFDPVAKRINFRNVQTQTIQQKTTPQIINSVKSVETIRKQQTRPIEIRTPTEQIKLVQSVTKITPSEVLVQPQTVTKDKVFQFLRKTFQKIPSSSQIEKFSRISDRKYQIVLIINNKYRPIKYQFTLTQISNGAYIIDDSQYVLDFVPSYQQFANTDDPFISDLDKTVRQSLPKQLLRDFKLFRVWRDDPFYKFYYTSGSNQYEIQFNFDPINRRVKIDRLNLQAVSESVVVNQEKVFTQPIPKTDPMPPINTQSLASSISTVSSTQTTPSSSVTSSSSSSSYTTTSKPIITSTISQIQKQIAPSTSSQTSYIVYPDKNLIIPGSITNTLVSSPIKIPQNDINTNFNLGKFDQYSRIPANKFTKMTTQDDPVILQMANFALTNLLPQIQAIDPNFKVNSAYYYFKNVRSIVFKFQITTEYGLSTYFFEVIPENEQVQKTVPLSQIIYNQVPALPKWDQPTTYQSTTIKQQVPLAPSQISQTSTIKYQSIPNNDEQKQLGSTLKDKSLSQTKPAAVKTTSTTSSPNVVEDAKKKELISFVRSSFNTLPQSAKIEKVTRLSDKKYLIVVIVIIRKREIRYQFTISQNTDGTYTVEGNQFNLDFEPSFQDYPNIDDSAITGLDGLVRDSIQGKLPIGAQLMRVERDEPFFRFYYFIGSSMSQVEFTFDPVAKKINIRNVKTEGLPETTKVAEPVKIVEQSLPVITKQSVQTIKSTESIPISVLKPSSQITVVNPISTKTTSSSISLEENKIPIKSTIQVPSEKTYGIQLSDNEVQNIYQKLSKQYKDVSQKSFKIYRVQKLDFGFRIVFKNDGEFYQAILRYNSINFDLKVLRWRKISQQEIQSSESLSQYYDISYDNEIENIVVKSFPKQKLGNIKRIISTKSRISGEGYWYELILETSTSHQYLVRIFNNPIQNFNEIISYEQINSQNYVSKQQSGSLSETEVVLNDGNSEAMSVLDFIQNKFDVLRNNLVIYVYRSVSNSQNVIYRVGLQNKFGAIYELIVSLPRGSSDLYLIKYSKLYEGYHLIDNANAEVRKAIQYWREVSKTQYVDLRQAQINSVLARQTTFGKFYRLICQWKYRNSIVIFVSNNGNFKLSGVQTIPSYYETLISRKWKSYGDISNLINSWQNYSKSQAKKSTVVIKKSEVSDHSLSQIQNEYDVDSDFHCLISRNNLCVKCSYRFINRQGQCIKIPDQCVQYDQNSGECFTCYTGYYLLNGRCQMMNRLCQQVDSKGICMKCYKGYDLIQGACFKTMTTRSSNLQRHLFDPLCEQQQNGVCVKCTGGCFWSRKMKKCAVKDPHSQQFDQVNEVVVKCERGYLISDKGICQRTY